MFKSISLRILTISILICLYIVACRKEFSYEGGLTPPESIASANGTLQDTLGNCRNIIVNGTYLPDSALNADNSITVTANITAVGKYQLFTDTVNGCWFMDTGTVNSTGLQSFTLKGYGKPDSLSFVDGFSVHFNNSVCSFIIPAQAAKYTFDASPGSCPDFLVKGTYYVGATLGGADSIVVPVVVTVPGAYSIQSDTVNGMNFSAKGIFTKAGRFSVAIKGSGLPAYKGKQAFSVNIDKTTCQFSIDVLIDASMYWQFTADGVTYSGILDSAYGVIGDTGMYFNYNPNRIFATDLRGTDNNADLNSSSFFCVLSRLNNVLTTGSYRPFELLGEADFNGYFQFSTAINSDWFYASSYKQKSFTFSVTTCDPVTKLFQGTFSGPVYKLKSVNDESGPIVNISNGIFKTYLAH